MRETNWMTKKRYEELSKKLHLLRTQTYLQNKQIMNKAIENGGGMHDNASYENALNDERLISKKITDLQSILKSSNIITKPTETGNVKISCKIRAINISTNEIIEVIIGGYMDTDTKKNIYSYQSPMAASFIGKEVGDEVKFTPPSKKASYTWEILEITAVDLENEMGD